MVNAAKKNVVVVGGGYAGIGVINSLDGKLPQDYRIVLVEKQDFMFLKMAGARVSASEDIANDVLVAYNRLFKNAEQGVVVQASVTEIKPHSVVLSTPHKLFGSEIDFEYLVIATGSSWNDPIELHTTSKAKASEWFAQSRKEIAAAKSIVIIGAGPVGIELSGEIRMAHPNTKITIVHADRLPVSDLFPESFRKRAIASLKEHGIDIVLGEKVDLSSIGKKGPVRLSSGKVLEADLVLVAVGATPQGEIIKTLSPALYNPKTHSIRVKETLQLADPEYPNIFVAGDVTDNPDLKMAYKAGLHAPIVAKNIASLIKGQTPSAVYKPTVGAESLTLPLGKMGGTSYLAFFGGITIGNWATRTLKGNTLFIPKSQKQVQRY